VKVFPSLPTGLKVALLCAAVPLVIGAADFVIWFVTGWNWPVYAGFLIVCGGLISVFVGVVCLVGGWAFYGLKRPTGFIAVLLLANLPVAAGIVWCFLQLSSLYVVTVLNHDPAPLTSAAITDGRKHMQMGDIKPGGRSAKGFRVSSGKGSVRFSGEQSARHLDLSVESYVTGGSGGWKVVDVHDSTVNVRPKQQPSPLLMLLELVRSSWG
jgi:hypothetical protein